MLWCAAIIATEIILLVSQLIPAIYVDYTLNALVFSIHGHPKGLSLWSGVQELLKQEAYTLGVGIATCSGVWPHIQLFLMLVFSTEYLPACLRVGRRQEYLLNIIHWTGRFSWLHVYVNVLAMFILDGDFYSHPINCLPGRHLIPKFMCGSNKPIGHMQAQPLMGIMLFMLSITLCQIINKLLVDRARRHRSLALRKNDDYMHYMHDYTPGYHYGYTDIEDDHDNKKPWCERLLLLLLMALAVVTSVTSMLKPFGNVTYKDGLGIGKLQRPGGASLSLFNALHECLNSNIDLQSTGRLLALLTLFSFCAGVAGLTAMCMLVMLCPTKKSAGASLRNGTRFFSELAIDILHLDVFWVAVVLVHSNADALAQTMRAEKMMSVSQVGKLQAGRSLVSVTMTLSANTWLMAVSSIVMWVVVGWSRKFLESAEEEVDPEKEIALSSLPAFQYDNDMGYMNTDYERDGLYTL